MATEAMQVQRGRCVKCGQTWVYGKFDEEAGHYGEFYCAACWDSWDETSTLSDSTMLLPNSQGVGISSAVYHYRVGFPLRNRLLSFVEISVEERMEDGIGCSLWTGAKVLLDYMERRLQPKLQGAKVLELGAGCGLPGMGLAQLGADVILTDMPRMCKVLESNVAINFANPIGAKAPKPRIASLRWGHQGDLLSVLELVRSTEGLDYVIGSEIIYDDTSHLLLIQTLEALVSVSQQAKGIASPSQAHPRTRILMACGLRPNEFEAFALRAAEAHWYLRVLERIDVQRLTGIFSHSTMIVVEMRQQSKRWQLRSALKCRRAKRRQHVFRPRKDKHGKISLYIHAPH